MDCRVKPANDERESCLQGVRGAPSFSFPSGKPEGMERREAPWVANALRRRARLRAGPRLSALHRGICRRVLTMGPAISPGPRFLNRHSRRPIQRAPRRAPFSSARAGSGAARVRGYEPLLLQHPAPMRDSVRRLTH